MKAFEELDVFKMEYSQFEWDVHILIEGTLEASIQYLGTEARKGLGKIEEALENPHFDDDHREYLVDEHTDVLVTQGGQERFLRNMALVALASRLAHALREMARLGTFSKRRDGRYGRSKASEFERLWAEYSERFGIDIANSGRADFVESMVGARNRVVHAGGEANTWKPHDQLDWNSGDEGLLETDFSKKYPEYVSGSGVNAEVRVSEELLDRNIAASIELVAWLAWELRWKELASAGRTPPARGAGN
jgi:hypothetical protein